MTVRVAAVALAASALFAAPALADPGRGSAVRVETRLGPSAGLVIEAGHRGGGHYGRSGAYRLNEWGQTRGQERQLRRQAVEACRAEIAHIAWRIGYRDVDFDDDRRIRQTGPNGFRIRFDDVEFESRRRERERDVTCIVRHGNVVQLEGIPDAGHYRPGRGYDDDYRRGRGHRHGY